MSGVIDTMDVQVEAETGDGLVEGDTGDGSCMLRPSYKGALVIVGASGEVVEASEGMGAENAV